MVKMLHVDPHNRKEPAPPSPPPQRAGLPLWAQAQPPLLDRVCRCGDDCDSDYPICRSCKRTLQAPHSRRYVYGSLIACVGKQVRNPSGRGVIIVNPAWVITLEFRLLRDCSKLRITT